MSVEPRQALYAHLRADPGVPATLNDGMDGIHQRRVPAGANKPLILIQPLISRVPARDLANVAWKRARIQVTVMADALPEAEAAARAVINAVEGYTGMMAGALEVILATVESDRQVEQEGIDEVYHHIDVMITYKE